MSAPGQPRPGHRLERDSLGEIDVPAERLWGAGTQRSLLNFAIGTARFRWTRQVVRAFGVVKQAAAEANGALGLLAPQKAAAIARAAAEVAAGRWDEEFPLVVFQTGSGTQSNMNANEVIAARANQIGGWIARSNEAVHPNDDVNLCQSSNDVFPTVMHIATVETLAQSLIPALTGLRGTLDGKARAFAEITMVGRTHLQDATPITLGQVISGWTAQLDHGARAIEGARTGLYPVALGGTAVGTGLNADPRFAGAAIGRIAALTKEPFAGAANLYAALSAHDAMVDASGALRTLAGALMKIANDVRWYASGPRAGIGELHIPENEPGSSIMPGKINPTQCEALTMVAVQVFGNDHAVAFAGSQGNFQLNVFKPIILHNVLELIELLGEAIHSFDIHCAQGIEPDRARIAEHLAASLMLATALSPHIGYEKSAKIALLAHHEGLSLREAALKLGFVSAEDFDRWINPASMTRPGLA